ncbi:MAG: hypothetical protein WCH32_10235 [Pseudomonadota bacterium]
MDSFSDLMQTLEMVDLLVAAEQANAPTERHTMSPPDLRHPFIPQHATE